MGTVLLRKSAPCKATRVTIRSWLHVHANTRHRCAHTQEHEVAHQRVPQAGTFVAPCACTSCRILAAQSMHAPRSCLCTRLMEWTVHLSCANTRERLGTRAFILMGDRQRRAFIAHTYLLPIRDDICGSQCRRPSLVCAATHDRADQRNLAEAASAPCPPGRPPIAAHRACAIGICAAQTNAAIVESAQGRRCGGA